jgi:hypothetical protein
MLLSATTTTADGGVAMATVGNDHLAMALLQEHVGNDHWFL